MRIFITKNGQQLGPYTLDQIHSQVNSGALQANDWAWYQGLADWIPLTHIPGYSGSPAPAYSGGVAAPSAPRKRPIAVWIISIYYFVSIPYGLIVLGSTFVRVFSLTGTEHGYLEYQNAVNLAFFGLVYLVDLAGAILLFLMRRPALYCFVGTFLVSVLNLGYQILFKNEFSIFESHIFILASMVFSYAVKIAVISYVGYLYSTKVLR